MARSCTMASAICSVQRMPERSMRSLIRFLQAHGTTGGDDMTPRRPRCCRSVPSNLEITGEQPLHTFFILNDHYHVHSFDTDLQPPASAGNRDERWRTPAIRRAAGGYAFASFGSEDKAAFDHVGHNGYAFGVLQHFFRDSLVGHS